LPRGFAPRNDDVIEAIPGGKAMRTKLSVCRRKIRFALEAEAVQAALEASITLRPYRCDRCAHFHLTSRTKGKRPLPGSDRA
jgi:hypothetical protein